MPKTLQKCKSQVIKFACSVLFRLAVSPRRTAQLHMHWQHRDRAPVPLGVRVETHLGHWFSMYPRSSNGLHEQRRIRPGWLGHRSPRTAKTYWHSALSRLSPTRLCALNTRLSTPTLYPSVSSLSLFIYFPPNSSNLWEHLLIHTNMHTPARV